MNRNDESDERAVDDKINDVLSNARPRPAPRIARKEQIYDELRDAWLADVSAAKRKQRFVTTGVAASILAAVIFSLQTNLSAPDAMSAPDAVLVRSTGSGTTLNGHLVQEKTPTNAPLRFKQGDELSTGPDAAVAVAWNAAGSLRISSSSAVIFTSDDRIELVEGTIYYDSKSHDLSTWSPIVVETPFGQIDHVGTQFVATVGGLGVNVAVREGEVSLNTALDTIVIGRGRSATVNQSRDVAFSEISATDKGWAWASLIAPPVDIDGRSTRDIIEWLSRETGRVVVYNNAETKAFAARDTIRGIGQIEPLEAMSIVPLAAGLQFQVGQETLRVGMQDQ